MENINKKISLLDLKYNKLRKVIHGVEIYNPDKKLKQEIMDEFIKKITEAKNEDNIDAIKLNIGTGELLTVYLPLLTSLDCPDDVLLINEILDNPSMELEDVIAEVSEILSNLFMKSIKIMLQVAESNQDVLNSENLTDEQKIAYLEGLGKVLENAEI